MVTRTVVIVDPYSSGVLYAPALRREGLTPVAVLSMPGPAPVFTSTFRPADFDEQLDAAEGLERVRDRLAQLAPVAIVPGTESGVELADALAAELTPHRANALDRARARRHKGEMVRALEARGVPAIRSVCTGDPQEVVRWLDRERPGGTDVVVKPTMSAGTDGVTLARDGQGWREAMTSLLGRVNPMGVRNEDVVVQERVIGTEYIVDMFSHDGRHTVTDICRYGKVHSGSNLAMYESVEFLPFDAPGHAVLIRYVEGVLDALGIRFGPTHSEVMVGPDGPRLIETNARLAGGGLPGAAQLATGENGVHRLVRYLCGETVIRHDFTLERCVLSVLFIAPRSGVVENVRAYYRIGSLPTCRHLSVNVHDGDWVGATSDLMATMRLGWAVLAGKDTAQVHADYARARAMAAQVRFRD